MNFRNASDTADFPGRLTQRLFRLRIRRHLPLVVAGSLLAGIAAISFFAPVVATHDPRHAVPADQLLPPSRAYFFGTDLLGRDVFSRVIYGGRRTLGLALLTAGITLPPGLAIGLAAGYAGRWLDAALMMIMDALLAVPSLLLALTLIALLDSGTTQIALAVGIAGIPAYARVTRAAVLEARNRPFVIAAQVTGAGSVGILWRHITPTISPPLLAFAGVTLSWAILNSAALMFLGYGGDVSAPEWGLMLADARQVYRLAPWTAAAPGAALSLTVFAINLLARGLDRREP